jgi:hypothetical protein
MSVRSLERREFAQFAPGGTEVEEIRLEPLEAGVREAVRVEDADSCGEFEVNVEMFQVLEELLRGVVSSLLAKVDDHTTLIVEEPAGVVRSRGMPGATCRAGAGTCSEGTQSHGETQTAVLHLVRPLSTFFVFPVVRPGFLSTPGGSHAQRSAPSSPHC